MTGSGFDAVAMLVQRLAVLTAAGIPALPAWRYVDAAIASEAVSARDLAARIRREGETRPGERSAWQTLACVWGVATESGAPLAPTLGRTAEVLRSLAQSARDVETVLAGPRATSRIVMALPAVALLLGALLGFDLLAAFASPAGLVCLGAAGILNVVAARWNRRLLAWARETDATPGLGFELHAVALAGGMSVARARALVDEASAAAALALHDDVTGVLEFASAAGVPVVALLRAEADERRRSVRAAAAARAARLESRLLLPLGLCVLPAFVLAGVVPIALAILSSTAGAL
ncbi:MAG: type II secretion system F family protein [Microbacteriaceae bacterium]